jgi:Anti-sigma factor NepR
VVKPVEHGIAKAATPLAKGETSGLQSRAVTMSRDEERSPAEVTSLARVRARKIEPKSEIVEQIGKRLRNVYNEVLFQPVPDRFHELLRALEAGTAAEAVAPAAGSDRGRQEGPAAETDAPPAGAEGRRQEDPK